MALFTHHAMLFSSAVMFCSHPISPIVPLFLVIYSLSVSYIGWSISYLVETFLSFYLCRVIRLLSMLSFRSILRCETDQVLKAAILFLPFNFDLSTRSRVKFSSTMSLSLVLLHLRSQPFCPCSMNPLFSDSHTLRLRLFS